MSDAAAIASPGSHWKRRPRAAPMPREHLNNDHAGLGGRPLALATESAAGRASVEAEIGRIANGET